MIYELLQLDIPATDTIYLTSNNENVVWNGKTWLSFQFELAERSESSKGEVPQVELKVSNISRIMEQYLHAYDNYLKLNGIEGNIIKCTLYIVNSEDLSNTTPMRSEFFELLQPKTDKAWASFSLGADNPFNNNAPKRKLIKNFCGFKFKGVECGYKGSGTCNKTLNDCRANNNVKRFGGFAGVGQGGVRL